ncbi:MAG: SoxR reducing system RseC family protein [bacterium]
MREQGIVSKILSPLLVEVSFQRSAACEKCNLCHGLDENNVGVEAVNEVGAKVGDKVEIDIPSQEVVKGSIVIFVLPLLLLIIGYLIGNYYFSESYAILLGFIFFVGSFWLVRWYDRKSVLRAMIIKVFS